MLLGVNADSVPRRVDWGGSERCSLAGRFLHGADHVLSFLVTLFFTRVKKRVTRSSVGGVEALAFKIRTEQELDSRLRGNDEQE